MILKTKFEVDIYHTGIELVLFDKASKEEAITYYKKHYNPDPTLLIHSTGLAGYHPKQYAYYAFIDVTEHKGLGFPYIMSIISHECTHLAYFILHEVGSKHSHENHEHFCYLQDTLVFNSVKLYEKFKAKLEEEKNPKKDD